jgi:hypothetical protein
MSVHPVYRREKDMTTNSAATEFETFVACVRSLLDGTSPTCDVGEVPEEYRADLQILCHAYDEGGTSKARTVWQRLIQVNPALAESISYGGSKSEFARSWGDRLVAYPDLGKTISQRRYVVDGLIPESSLSVIFGQPGHFKSMLAMDLCVAVSAGQSWLPSAGEPHSRAFETAQCRVLWIDFDQGESVVKERLVAIGKSYGLTKTHDYLDVVSMPDISLDIGNNDRLSEFAAFVQERKYGLVVVDTLTDVKGSVDENSAEMGAVLGNVRRFVCDITGAAVVFLHHPRKGNGERTHVDGESMRGSGAINAKLDLALHVHKKDDDVIVVQPTKTRAAPVMPFEAIWRHESDPSSQQITSARFYLLGDRQGIRTETIDSTILSLIDAKSPENMGKLVAAVRTELDGIGEKKIRDHVHLLVHRQLLVEESTGKTTGKKHILTQLGRDILTTKQ